MGWKGFWRGYDWLARADFANTLSGGLLDWRTLAVSFGGSAVTFLWAAIREWDALTVWLATIGTGAAIAIICIALSLVSGGAVGAQRSEEIRARFDAAGEKMKSKMMTGWLASSLAERALSVNRAFLFGSIVHEHYPTSDVDVIVEFLAINDRKLGSVARKIREPIARDFERTFGHKLHITFFCSDEDDPLESFLLKAGNHLLIFSRSALGT